MLIYWVFKFRRILKLSKNINSESSLAFGSDSLLQHEWQMLSHFRKGKDTRHMKNHEFSVLCAKDKAAQLTLLFLLWWFLPNVRTMSCTLDSRWPVSYPSPPKAKGLMLYLLQNNCNFVTSFTSTSLLILVAFLSPAVTIIPLYRFILQP